MMLDIDERAAARALNLADFIDADTRDYRQSIILAQITSAREAAIEALRELVDAPPFDPQRIMTLQNEVKRFRELVHWLQDARANAAAIFHQLPHDEQAEVLAFLNPRPEINDA